MATTAVAAVSTTAVEVTAAMETTTMEPTTAPATVVSAKSDHRAVVVAVANRSAIVGIVVSTIGVADRAGGRPVIAGANAETDCNTSGGRGCDCGGGASQHHRAESNFRQTFHDKSPYIPPVDCPHVAWRR